MSAVLVIVLIVVFAIGIIAGFVLYLSATGFFNSATGLSKSSTTAVTSSLTSQVQGLPIIDGIIVLVVLIICVMIGLVAFLKFGRSS